MQRALKPKPVAAMLEIVCVSAPVCRARSFTIPVLGSACSKKNEQAARSNSRRRESFAYESRLGKVEAEASSAQAAVAAPCRNSRRERCILPKNYRSSGQSDSHSCWKSMQESEKRKRLPTSLTAWKLITSSGQGSLDLSSTSCQDEMTFALGK